MNLHLPRGHVKSDEAFLPIPSSRSRHVQELSGLLVNAVYAYSVNQLTHDRHFTWKPRGAISIKGLIHAGDYAVYEMKLAVIITLATLFAAPVFGGKGDEKDTKSR